MEESGVKTSVGQSLLSMRHFAGQGIPHFTGSMPGCAQLDPSPVLVLTIKKRVAKQTPSLFCTVPDKARVFLQQMNVSNYYLGRTKMWSVSH
jgi:hypothetical protein